MMTFFFCTAVSYRTNANQKQCDHTLIEVFLHSKVSSDRKSKTAAKELGVRTKFICLAKLLVYKFDGSWFLVRTQCA